MIGPFEISAWCISRRERVTIRTAYLSHHHGCWIYVLRDPDDQPIPGVFPGVDLSEFRVESVDTGQSEE